MDNRLKEKYIKLDKKNIWHPFTQMADWINDRPSKPLIIDKANNVYLYDVDGRRYIDGVSSLWVNILGHRNSLIDKAIKAQINKVSHSTFLGLTHIPAIRLSEKLLSILPKKLSKVFYSDNGSTAVEVALKMAYQYWQFKNEKRTRFLSLKNAYHGDTIGAVSVSGTDLFHSRFKSLLFKNYFAMSPYCYRCKFRTKDIYFPIKAKDFKDHNLKVGCTGECIKQVEEVLSKHSKQIAAAIIEPLNQAAAGMIMMPKGYLSEYAKLCKKYDIFLICDEVATGFGRTGKIFGIDHENVQPDFMCLSKGITGGYLPLAATVTTNKIYNAFSGKYEEFKTFFHGHSYTANPLACAAANAVMDILMKENTLKKIDIVVKHLEIELKKLSEHAKVGNIRHCGVMAGIEVVENKKTGKPFNPKLKIGANICIRARKHNIIIRNLGDTLVLFLPLVITKTGISKIIKAIKIELDNI